MSETPLNGRLVTMLLAGGMGERLFPITAGRSKPAVPFGGNFRIIDFTLNNCLMSGIRQVYALTQYHTLSLNRHLRERWSFLAKELGEFIEVVPSKMRTPTGLYQGTADAIFRNLDILEEHRPDAVLILSGDHIYRADYRALLRHHVEIGADATVLTDQIEANQAHQFGVLRCGEGGRILGFLEKPADPRPYADAAGRCSINLGIYCFNTRFLVQQLVADAKKKTSHDIGKNILPAAVGIGKIHSIPLARVSPDAIPYWRDVGSIDSFFAASMDLLAVPPAFDLRDPRWPAGARFEEWLPARVISGKEGSGAASLISPGAVIDRARVTRSVISPKVRIEEAASVNSCILFHGAQVGRGARLRKVIVEEGVSVPPGVSIGYEERKHARSPGGVVVIARGHPFRTAKDDDAAPMSRESLDGEIDRPADGARTVETL